MRPCGPECAKKKKKLGDNRGILRRFEVGRGKKSGDSGGLRRPVASVRFSKRGGFYSRVMLSKVIHPIKGSKRAAATGRQPFSHRFGPILIDR